jgi:hypothetical protein
MVLAAAGCLALSYLLFIHVNPDIARIAGRFGHSLFRGLSVLIPGPSGYGYRSRA